jgi:transcriptional regulator with XRE-family HTH domain
MKTARSVNEIGRLIKYHRQKKSLTQAQLAKTCDLSQVFISKLENGSGGTMSTLVRVMKGLGLELSLREIKKIDTENLANLLE